MKKTKGLIIVVCDSYESKHLFTDLIEHASALTPEGRILAIIYTMPKNWSANPNFEQMSTEILLKSPLDRDENPTWEFFGNLAVRSCRLRGNTRSIDSEFGVVLFRKSGEKPYLRRKSASPELLRIASLPTLHPVFTRDVANNVWHVEAVDPVAAIINRLSILLTWPDEHTTVFKNGGSRNKSRPIANFDQDLIGVPTKIDYPWADSNYIIDFNSSD